MCTVEYDMSTINSINMNDVYSNETNIDTESVKTKLNNLKLTHKHWIKNNKTYNILKYTKETLTHDMIDKTGLFRSVIYSNNKINVFSPPKALHITSFMNLHNNVEECISEEFIEGTMINVFYDEDIGTWEIASKTTVGAEATFSNQQSTFSKLFYEICDELNISFDSFSKDLCYSFVMQHPKNKFVIPIIQKRLYLVGVYKIDNESYKVTEIPKYNFYNQLGNVWFPMIYRFSSYEELINLYGSMNTPTNIMGIVIYHKDGHRTKIRNPNYEYVKHLKGNTTKLQFQYLCLRKLGQVKESLKFFPENKRQFALFKSQIHLFTDNLYTNYISCYIKKEKPLKEFAYQFRNHMYQLHQHYLSIRQQKGYINKIVVVNYVNNLEPARLMYSLNYHLRHVVDTKQTTEEQSEQSMEINP